MKKPLGESRGAFLRLNLVLLKQENIPEVVVLNTILITLLSVAPFVVTGMFWLKPELASLFGASVDRPLTIIGVFLSYFSLLFSMLAVLEVRRLSQRNLVTQRLPDLQKQARKLSEGLFKEDDTSFVALQKNASIGSVGALLDGLERLKIPELKKYLDNVRTHFVYLEKLVKQSTIDDDPSRTTSEFLSLARELSALVDAADQLQKSMKVSR